MKWFKHETDDRNKLESKLIRSKFGAKGYGIFQSLKEIVAEFVEGENIKEWGLVHPLHTVETLADECSATPDELREFLKFCNEKGIIQKQDGRLYYEDMLKRLDDFAARIKRQSRVSTNKVRSNYDINKKRKEKKKIEDINIGKAQKNDIRGSRPQMASVGDVLNARRISEPSKSSGISKEWQEKAFREMEYLGIDLKSKDIGRVFKIYKEESEGKKHKATTSQVISYLKDYPGGLDYDGTLKMFFKLVMNGINYAQ